MQFLFTLAQFKNASETRNPLCPQHLLFTSRYVSFYHPCSYSLTRHSDPRTLKSEYSQFQHSISDRWAPPNLNINFLFFFEQSIYLKCHTLIKKSNFYEKQCLFQNDSISLNRLKLYSLVDFMNFKLHDKIEYNV